MASQEVDLKKATKGVIKQSKPAGEEQKVIFTHRIERRVKIDPTEKDRTLFKNLTFFFEILHDGKSIDGYFKTKTLELGGRVIERLTKNATHLVWSQGT